MFQHQPVGDRFGAQWTPDQHGYYVRVARHEGQLGRGQEAPQAPRTFLVFGAVLLGPALKHITWQIALYAVLSLTLARMLPVAIAMIGTGARPATLGFLGWFGPRGLASIVFAVIVVEEAHLRGAQTILLTAYLTIGLSVFAHGISAAPLARAYARWYESRRHALDALETVPVSEHRPRGPAHVSW